LSSWSIKPTPPLKGRVTPPTTSTFSYGLYAAGLDIYEKVFGKFDEAKADTIYQQYAIIATTLRVPPEMWPANRKAFWEYWDSMIASLPITPHATKVASDLLYNNKAPLLIRLNMPIVRLLTAEWLPPHM
jgi:uncharacterized protein (DUF2236 family)